MGGEQGGQSDGFRHDVPALLPNGKDGFADEATGRLFDEVAPSIVRIYSSRKPTEYGPTAGTGSGYFIDNEGRVMTDSHIVRDSKELWITARDGKEYRGQVEKVDDIQDLAIIKLVGVQPGQYKPLEPGSSQSLINGDPIFALGHPHGSRDAFVSPGRYIGPTNMLDVLLRRSGPDQVGQMMNVNDYKNPYDFYDFVDNLRSPVIGGRLRLETGNSGGPVVDGSGKVVGITREVELDDHSFSYYSPVEKADSLLRNPRTKFSFQYGYEPEPWAQRYKDLWKEQPLGAAGLTAFAGGAGYFGAGYANKFSPKALPLVTGAYFTHKLLDDYDLWKTSTNKPDSNKFGIATLADATALGGSIAALFPKARTVGLIALGVGATARLASDFISNNLVMKDVVRDDGSHRAPFDRFMFIEQIKYESGAGKPSNNKRDNSYAPPSSRNNPETPPSNSDNGGYDKLYNNPYLNKSSGMPRLDSTLQFPK
jgi:Trypsin-like serine proteases, typically periplasmic, contain C-terminal PDZ domain